MNDVAEKWTSHPVIKENINNAISNYLQQFSSDEADVVKKMLLEFSFYDQYSFDLIIDNFINNLEEKCDYQKDFFVAVHHDRYNHHSDIFYGKLKQIKIYRLNGKKWKNDLNNKTRIIILDDYSGSGNSIIKTIERIYNVLNDLIKQFEIIIAPMIITNEAHNIIDKTLEQMRINYKFFDYSINREAKFISNNKLLTMQEKEVFYRFSKQYINVGIDYVDGYNSTEDLLAFSDFTPNNTLGFFWWECTELYIPLFKKNRNRFFDQNCCISKEYILEIKKCILEETIINKKEKALLAMFIVLGFEKDKCINLMHINQKKYEKILSKILEERVINNNTIGENFSNYVDVERFELVTNSINGTDYERICRNLISTIKK